MRIVARSVFHGNLQHTFNGIEPGANFRRIRKRAKFCLDYSHNNSHVCGCGFPISRTAWECPEGYDIDTVEVCGDPTDYVYEYGRTHLKIVVKHENT